jgi:hypothetical protein
MARRIISSLCGLAALVVTAHNIWSDWPGDDPQTIQEVSRVVERFTREHGKNGAPSWNEVATAADRLDPHLNRNLARAKALMVLDRHPEPYSDYEWQNRAEGVGRSYQECSKVKQAGISLGFGALAAGAAALVSWLLLLLLSWVWYFSLDRIQELAMAIRSGQGDKE